MNGPIAIKRREPALGPNPDYSKALYPDPPSHDFCVWLIIAELMRRHHNAPAPLKVKLGLIDGRLGAVDFGPTSLVAASTGRGTVWQCGVNRQYFETMLANVMRPAMEMIGAVEEPAVDLQKVTVGELAQYVEYDYHIGHLVDAGRQGHPIPQWQPPQWAFDEVDAFLKGERPVIITLRETTAQPERNSAFLQWIRFAQTICKRYPVLFVRDTALADKPITPFRTYPRASTNAYVRAALYQRALVNMLVCNGPCVWLQFSNAPYLMFKQLVPALPDWAHGQACGWRDQDHMDVGEQLPWATPLQRMTWTDDTYENIMAAFDDFVKNHSTGVAA